jgi:hypothetical protein
MSITPRIAHDDLVVDHKVTTLSDGKEVYVTSLCEPDGTGTAPSIVFHKGSPVEGWHGWTTAHVITGLIKHMEYFQTTPFGKDPNARAQNEKILEGLHAALDATKKRVDDRKERGVLYDTEKV